jgi:hypothetical protein
MPAGREEFSGDGLLWLPGMQALVDTLGQWSRLARAERRFKGKNWSPLGWSRMLHAGKRLTPSNACPSFLRTSFPTASQQFEFSTGKLGIAPPGKPNQTADRPGAPQNQPILALLTTRSVTD